MRRSWLTTTVSISSLAAAALSFAACVTPTSHPDDEPIGEDTEESSLAVKNKACDAEGDCRRNLYCARAESTCNGAGTCQTKPDACLDIYAPVCGCDGVTYSNSCFAAMMGTSVKFEGSCDVSCTSNAECGKAYCGKPQNACGAAGVCRQKPELCQDIVKPVCGCDGVTYVNACFAAQSGASVSSTGECH